MFRALAYCAFARKFECGWSGKADSFKSAANLSSSDVIEEPFKVDNRETFIVDMWSKGRYVGSLWESSERRIRLPMTKDAFPKMPPFLLAVMRCMDTLWKGTPSGVRLRQDEVSGSVFDKWPSYVSHVFKKDDNWGEVKPAPTPLGRYGPEATRNAPKRALAQGTISFACDGRFVNAGRIFPSHI
jgi:hypothetical protein